MTAALPRLFPADAMRAFVTTVFERMGVPAEHARIAADVLVEADLRGFDCHGVGRLYACFLRLQRGLIDPRPEIVVDWRAPSSGRCDGGNGLGMVVGHVAMKAVIERASSTGAAFLAVERSNHFGIAGYYSTMATAAGMIGIAMCNASPRVVPTGASAGVFGTNPISVAFPGPREPSFVLDMATSAVSSGKIDVVLRRGEPIPSGWLYPSAQPHLDGEGVAPMDVLQYPLGGPREQGGYKGYGLAMMVDLFCGALSGANTGRRLAASKDPDRQANIGHFFGALQVGGFRDVDGYHRDVASLVRDVKSSPREPGVDEILVAGDPEAAARRRNLRDGIPVLPPVEEKLRTIARELGIAGP